MKILLLASSLLFSFTSIKAADKIPVLKAIDDICGDTWCEGDFDFTFNEVIMDTNDNSTKVLFEMRSQDFNFIDVLNSQQKNFQGRIESWKFNVSCVVPGYSTYEAIMQSNGHSLNWDFYMSLTDCIQALEHRLNKIYRD